MMKHGEFTISEGQPQVPQVPCTSPTVQLCNLMLHECKVQCEPDTSLMISYDLFYCIGSDPLDSIRTSTLSYPPVSSNMAWEILAMLEYRDGYHWLYPHTISMLERVKHSLILLISPFIESNRYIPLIFCNYYINLIISQFHPNDGGI